MGQAAGGRTSGATAGAEVWGLASNGGGTLEGAGSTVRGHELSGKSRVPESADLGTTCLYDGRTSEGPGNLDRGPAMPNARAAKVGAWVDAQVLTFGAELGGAASNGGGTPEGVDNLVRGHELSGRPVTRVGSLVVSESADLGVSSGLNDGRTSEGPGSSDRGPAMPNARAAKVGAGVETRVLAFGAEPGGGAASNGGSTPEGVGSLVRGYERCQMVGQISIPNVDAVKLPIVRSDCTKLLSVVLSKMTCTGDRS